MAPGDKLHNIADQAERELNTYEAKTGVHKTSPNDEAGVDSRVENKFPGAKVRYDQDLSTNRGYNKRIPPEEGGDTDARGRQTRGEHFEGVGGPEHKLQQQAREYGGENTFDPSGRRQPGRYDELGTAQDTTVPYQTGRRDVLPEGREAVQSNLQSEGQPRQKNQFKGEDYYTPESVPDSISAEGWVPPESVIQSSREAERP